MTLQTLAELDLAIAEADVPGADRGGLISSIMYKPDITDLRRLDPFSTSYSEIVHRIYQHLWGGDYDVADEANTFGFDVTEPSPYNSHHPNLICTHLGSIVTVIRDIGKLPPARVLDLGFGHGDTSLLLARCGFEVDAIDVNEKFVNNLKYWADRFHVDQRIQVANRPFDTLDTLEHQYDVVLFFEAFHHSINHIALIETIVGKLKSGGVMIFAGEPIYDHFPLPWGLRHEEGLATYCIRKFGWMELGFHTAYFLELLERNGVFATRREYMDYPVANHFRAQKIGQSLPISDLCIREPYADGWHAGNAGTRWTKGLAGLPLRLCGGAAKAEIVLQNCAPMHMTVLLKVDDEVLAVAEIASGEISRLVIDLPAIGDALWFDAPSWSPKAVGLSSDERTLGIAVLGISFL